MKTFTEFSGDEIEVDQTEKSSANRHKVKEQLNRIDPNNWDEYDDKFERFEKFKSRK